MHHSKRNISSQILSKQNTPGVTTTSKTLKLATFATFDQEPLNKVLAVIIASVHVLQTFCLSLEAAFYSFLKYGSSIEDFVKTTQDFFIARNVIDFDNFDAVQITVLALIMIYLLCNTSIIIFSLQRFFHMKPIPHWVLKHWKNLGNIHLYCLFLPIHNILTELMARAHNSGLSTGTIVGIMIPGIIMEVLNIVFYLLQLHVTINIKTRDPLATLDNSFLKVDFAKNIILSVLGLLIVHLKVLTITPIILNVINVGLVAYFAFIFLQRLPFFSKIILGIFMFEIGVILCSSVISFILSIFYESGFKIDISFALIVIFLIIPVYVKSALNFISRRMEKTLTQSFEYFTHRSSRLGFNKYWFIHAIYHLRSILKVKMRPNYLSKEFSSKKLVQFGHIKFLKSLLFKKEGHLSHINTDDQNMRVFIVKFMEAWLKKHADDNIAKLVLADLLISDFGVMYGPYVLIEQIFKKSHTLSHKISAMRIRESIQGVISSYNAGANFKLDLTLFFEGSQMLDKLKQKITRQIEESYKFHYRILDRNPDLNSIIRSAEKIRTLKKDVKDIWSSIPERLLESYTPLSLAYGIYKYSTNYEYTEGREVLQKFRNILKKQAHYRNNSAINEDTVTSENNVSFLIGTSKTNLGSIVYCSANTKKFFGETAQNLTGKNVTTIMPPFFQTIHDSLIMKKLESPDNLLKLKYFPTFGMDKQGYVFPINLLINLFPWINRGFYFSGIVRPIKDRLNYILLDDQGYINSYSKPLRHKLNLPPSIHNEKINIIHLCMSFDTINQALNQCSRTVINKHESVYGFDLEGLWKIDSTNRTHENETEFRTREDESNLGSPDPMSSPQISSPSRPRGKSKFSFAATSNQIIRDGEMEALATEMMVKGRVLHFRAFNYDQFADTLKSLKSYKGTIFSDHPGPAIPISKGTIASVVTEVSSFSHAITRKQAYFHCRVDIKKYLGRTLKVVILDEVTTVPNDDNTVINQRTLIQNKRYSFRRQLLPLINKKQNTGNPRSQSPSPRTSPPPNSFSPLYDDPQQPTSLATSPPLKLQEIGELSYEDLPIETEEAIGRGLIDARDFERGRRNGLQRMKEKGGSEDYSSSGASRSASPSNVDSSGNINTISNESVPLSPHRVDNNPLKIERPRRLTADPDKSSKSSRDLLSVNYLSSNNDPLRKRGSETYSNSKLDFDIVNPQSSQGNGSSNVGIDSLKSNAHGGLKFQQKHKAIELAEYLPTMKFYKFHQAKIPFLWLVLCLVALVVCNAVIFTIATDTIPVVQESVGLMRSAINRIMTLVAIFRQTTNLKYFVVHSIPFQALAQGVLHGLGSDLDNYNMDISEKVNLISANFSSYMFTENIKLYTTDFGNYSSPNNFMMANSFQSVTLMSGHALRASQATDYTDNTFLYSLEFIIQNSLNDLLIKLAEEPPLIIGEVQRIIDQTTTYSLTVFVITGVIFLAGGIFLVVIKLKSLFDAKEFLGFFTSYSHKDISPLLEKMDWLKQLLGSMMHDDLLLKHFKASDCFFTTYKYHRDKTKIPRTRKYLLRIFWRIIVKLILLLVPIIIVLNLNDRFSTSFRSVSPIFLEVVAAKNVIMATDLVFAATLYSIIFPGNVRVENYPISPIVSAGIELLDDAVLNMSSRAHLETYELYHMDFCQFVSASDYDRCKNIYEGISTSGLIGSVLSIQSFLRSYKLAFDTNNTTQIAYVSSQSLVPDTDTLISFMKEAVETKEEERVDYLMQILKDCQTSIITLTVVSLIVSVLLGIIAGWQVYLPSKRERESICEILLLFPSNMIIKNKRLRPYLTRDSPAFTELFKMQNY